MRANEKLIAALRKVATDIETEAVLYNWQNPECCNCGLLARELMRADGITGISCRQGTTWSQVAKAEARCILTGFPMREVFKVLERYGIDLADISQIEYLGRVSPDPVEGWREVMFDGWVENPNFNSRMEATRFFRELAGKLEAELRAETEQVTIPAKVLEVPACIVPERIVPECIFGEKEKEKQQQEISL